MAKKSGGIAIVYKQTLEENLKFIQSDSEFVQWVKILNQGVDLQNDILLGCIYIPPEGSKYASLDAFDVIENEMSDLLKNCNMHCALLGKNKHT